MFLAYLYSFMEGNLNGFHLKTISHEEINVLPLMTFPGKVAVINDPGHLPEAFNEVKKHAFVGFDTETRPSFHKGQIHIVSLMQIAIPGKVFLIRLKQTGITPDIIEFIQNESIIKSGVGVRDDIHALNKVVSFQPGGFLELSLLAKEAGLQVESVKKLTALLLGFRISKGAQTSNWEAATLTQKQIEYAATDAWVCFELYKKLIKKKV